MRIDWTATELRTLNATVNGCVATILHKLDNEATADERAAAVATLRKHVGGNADTWRIIAAKVEDAYATRFGTVDFPAPDFGCDDDTTNGSARNAVNGAGEHCCDA